MNISAARSLVTLAVLVGAAGAFPSAVAVTASPTVQSAAPTQQFAGGGTGNETQEPTGYGTNNYRTRFFGSYTSSGQLGRGQLGFIEFHGARLVRSDGMVMTGTAATFRQTCDAPPNAMCATLDLHGPGDVAQAHLVLIGPRGAAYSPNNEVSSFIISGTLTLNPRIGYAMAAADGATYAFGGIDHLGDAHIAFTTDLELTPTRQGYWITNASGQVYAFGDARSFGNANVSAFARGEVVTSMSATPSAKGYWLFTSRGRALAFGDAKFLGDLVATPLQGGVVGSVATPTGKGYYMVGSDGGVFAFGDAKFRGSTGNMRLNKPIVGLVPTPDNTGYWLVASDGGVFSFNAPFHGSLGAIRLNRPIVSMARYGNAYLMVASDGGVFNFSNGPFFGSLADTRLTAPVVNAAAGS